MGNVGSTICAMPATVAMRQYFPDVWGRLLMNKKITSNLDSEDRTQRIRT